jgi:AcrR family transcriptional regulator
VFSRQGYALTRLEDIAQEAGVTRGAIYWHFGSKAELYNTLIQTTWERISALIDFEVESAIQEGKSVLGIFRSAWQRMFEAIADDAEIRAVMELTFLKTELLPELEAGMQVKLAYNQTIMDELEDVMRMGIAAGEVKPDIDVHLVIVGVMALQAGLIESWFMDGKQFSLRTQAIQIVDIYLQGIRV